MIRIRPVVIEKCCLCGEEMDRMHMKEVFTGRVKYICPKCQMIGDEEIKARRSAWRNSARGKQVINEAQKHK